MITAQLHGDGALRALALRVVHLQRESVMYRPAASCLHPMITLDVGDDWLIEVACSNADGTAMDLTGAAIEWKFATALGEVLHTLTVGAGITIVPVDPPAAPAKCMVFLPHALTRSIEPGLYRDQLRVTTTLGIVSTQSRGDVTVAATL